MGWWGLERRYEKEYELATRVGEIVARKMTRENTRAVKLRVYPENQKANWFAHRFGGYTTGHGGWSNTNASNCFHRELFRAWFQAMPEDQLDYELPSSHIFRAIRTRDCILFIHIPSQPGLVRCIAQIQQSLAELDQLDHLLRKSNEKDIYRHQTA